MRALLTAAWSDGGLKQGPPGTGSKLTPDSLAQAFWRGYQTVVSPSRVKRKQKKGNEIKQNKPEQQNKTN